MAASTAAIIGTAFAIAAALFLLHSTRTAEKKADQFRNEVGDEFKTAATERAGIRTEISAVRTDIGTILARLPEPADTEQSGTDAAPTERDAPADTAGPLPSPAELAADTSGLTIAAHAVAPERDDQ